MGNKYRALYTDSERFQAFFFLASRRCCADPGYGIRILTLELTADGLLVSVLSTCSLDSPGLPLRPCLSGRGTRLDLVRPHTPLADTKATRTSSVADQTSSPIQYLPYKPLGVRLGRIRSPWGNIRIGARAHNRHQAQSSSMHCTDPTLIIRHHRPRSFLSLGTDCMCPDEKASVIKAARIGQKHLLLLASCSVTLEERSRRTRLIQNAMI